MQPSPFTLWAKLDQNTWPNGYHPLLCHMLDVGLVAQKLFLKAIECRVRTWVRTTLGLPDDHTTAKWIGFWVAAHDIGKASPGFQVRGDDPRMAQLKKTLQDAGFEFPTGAADPHAYVSSFILADALAKATNWPKLSVPLANKIAIVVGGHHGLFPDKSLDAYKHPDHGQHWRTVQHDLLTRLAKHFQLNGLAVPQLPSTDSQAIWMHLAGLTSVADWIGSNKTFFLQAVDSGKSALTELDEADYFQSAALQADHALQELGWLGRITNRESKSFVDLFHIPTPRPLQREIETLANQMTEPMLYIVEAPMGEGKTEAAWYVADCWDRRGGQGTYVALPTMATSNQMFERVEKFLATREGKSNLQLLHGKAQLSKDFEKLKYQAEIYEEGRNPSAVVAESWFASDRRQGLLAPFGVGTVDQSLMAILQTKHVFVRLFGLAGKCVILDEIHAYDAYMTTLLERLLSWLSALGCPVVLLSATLPKDRREKLLQAYSPWNAQLPEAPYPRITTAGGGQAPKAILVAADDKRKRTVQLEWLAEAEIKAKLDPVLINGGCICIIRNTVGLAQETYSALKEAYAKDIESGELHLSLFHARFPFGSRAEIEKKVLSTFGKGDDGPNNPKRPKRAILVATQVVEQSLDLDFDLMISDLAPADLILQRAGRIWRHDRCDRRTSIIRPTLWLLKPEFKNEIPDFGVSGIVYAKHILFRSFLEFQFKNETIRDTIHIPDEIDYLVEVIYRDSPPPENMSQTLQQYWRQTDLDMKVKKDAEEAEAECRRIRRPKYSGSISKIVQTPREEENPDLHPAHQALTRLTGPSAQLIVLLKDSEGNLRLPHNNQIVSSIRIRPLKYGGWNDVQAMMYAELTTSHRGLVSVLWDAPLQPSEWKDVSPLMRHHLVLFENGQAKIGSYTLELDFELGLRVMSTKHESGDE